MNDRLKSILHRFHKDQSGQMLPVMAFMTVAFLSTAALSIDLGRAYFDYRELQASTNAAALAGAQSLPQTTATANATDYSSVTGDLNAATTLPNVSLVSGYPKLLCLTTLKNIGVACSAPANANAIQVKQQMVVPLFFAQLFGKQSLTLVATATAGMRGSVAAPYNVAIIVDTTASMSDTDSDSQCNSSRLSCALAGVQVLLKNLAPCGASMTTCGSVTSGNVANPVDVVSLFTFPNVTPATASADYDCSGSTNPTTEPYTAPTAGASSYTNAGSPTVATYQITPFNSDYRSSDTATTLSTTSNIVLAIGGKSGCTGMQDPGGEGTYYAGAIYAAESALVAAQTANPGSLNVLILVSDGDASAKQAQMDSTATNSGNYPSWVDQCGQAIIAAKAAATAGTKVYSVAYGAESSGCSTDTSGTYSGYTPCQTMEAIASASQNFFSDYTQSGTGSTCISASQPTSNLSQIFTDIAGDLTVAKLIPNNTT
jgi:Flp pilus assembly protein TadG